MMAIFEMIVAVGLTKKIHVTRLPVGHTHEDIDGRFGKIWTAIRSQSILTPQEYKSALLNVFKDSRLQVEVIDVFSVPDYKSFFNNCIDQTLGR